MQTGVSIEMLWVELVTKEIQHLRQDYGRNNISFIQYVLRTSSRRPRLFIRHALKRFYYVSL